MHVTQLRERVLQRHHVHRAFDRRLWKRCRHLQQLQRRHQQRLSERWNVRLWKRSRVPFRSALHGNGVRVRFAELPQRLLLRRPMPDTVPLSVRSGRQRVRHVRLERQRVRWWVLPVRPDGSVWLGPGLQRERSVRVQRELVSGRVLQRERPVRDRRESNARVLRRNGRRRVRHLRFAEGRHLLQRRVLLRHEWRAVRSRPALLGRNVRVRHQLGLRGLLQRQHVRHQSQQHAVRSGRRGVHQLRRAAVREWNVRRLLDDVRNRLLQRPDVRHATFALAVRHRWRRVHRVRLESLESMQQWPVQVRQQRAVRPRPALQRRKLCL